MPVEYKRAETAEDYANDDKATIKLCAIQCLLKPGKSYTSRVISPTLNARSERMKEAMSRLIIVIDDSLTIRKILETCLQREGYEVRSFVDGVEALRWLASPEGMVPALIVLDLMLPRMDGLSVLHCLKRKPALAAVPVVVLSRRELILDRLKTRLAGANAYLTKPFKTGDVLAIINRLIVLPADKEPMPHALAPSALVAECVPLQPDGLQRLEAIR